VGKPFTPNPKQIIAAELMSRPQLHTCFVGGARAGKTFWIVRAIILRAMRAPSSRHLIARHRYKHVVASIWNDTLPKVMRECWPDIQYVNHIADGYLTLQNGSEIWFLGLDEKERVDKVLGLEFATIFLNECSQISFASTLVVRTRLAQKIAGLPLRAYYDLNPTGSMHWTNREFGQGKDPMTGQPLFNPEDYARIYMNPEDNAENLDEATLRMYRNLPGKYRKRFYEGVYVPEIENALWTMDTLALCRRRPEEVNINQMQRMVVGVDPSGTKGDEETRSNEVGIIVAGLGWDGCGYLFDDLTCNLPPEGWARRVINAYRNYMCDHVIAESNFGGDMVRATIHAADRSVPVRMVTASRGKALRAEPISALYEPTTTQPGVIPAKGKIFHVGDDAKWARLEEQMLNFSSAGYEGDKSPDAVDAAVHALTDLMIDKHTRQDHGVVPQSIPIFAR
jgi:hypothetical protein